MSCEEDMFSSLTPEQQNLLGKGVNFNASIADPFYTRASWADLEGRFSVGEQMVIYRQYWTGSAFGEEAYRQYSLVQKYAAGTGSIVSLGDPNWLPLANRAGGNWDTDEKKTVTFSQTDADSLTWDNDRTVRFRAIGRSNYANCINSDYAKEYYYPDYTISDWITVSGPTTEIPFVMKHLGSRIFFSPLNTGNQILKIEISTTAADYERNDNSVSKDDDESDKIIVDENGQTLSAADAASNVAAVYNRMCMPAGVDKETGMLLAMTKKFYDEGKTEDFQKILEKPILAEGTTVGADNKERITFGTQTPDNISTYIQRPVFTSRMNSWYSFLVTIPYDMSNSANQGEVLVLPPYTRFRVWLFDTNNGDGVTSQNQNGNNVNKTEGNYHILSLSDFKETFKDGLELSAGASYQFRVGYQYDQFVAEVAPSFSWTEQDLDAQDGPQVNTDPSLSAEPYKWWKDAIDAAILEVTTQSSDYNPVFEIKTPQEFLEFINLVNGTAADRMSGLEQAKRTIYNLDGTVNAEKSGYWWYTGITADGDTLWTTREAMEAQGYIFYNQYIRSVGDIRAEARETYLKGPFSFYDASFSKAFSVKLGADLDMDDWKLASIGTTITSASFMGAFDGQNHTIKNLYMKDEYLFENISGADVRNLRLTSTHDLALVKEATGANYIAGISLKANSSKSSIANSIIGVDAEGRKNPTYVVGCIHEGTAGDGMIGKADDLFMYGCMETAGGIPSGTGALLGEYYNDGDRFFAPQSGKFAEWGRFMCNYYNTESSPGTYAAAVAGVYKPQEYIRGVKMHVLKAVKDYLLPDETPYNKLSDVQKSEIYGLAPWKAMNYGIYKYNTSSIGEKHPCTMHYENTTSGYTNRYPQLEDDVPSATQYANVLEQNN